MMYYLILLMIVVTAIIFLIVLKPCYEKYKKSAYEGHQRKTKELFDWYEGHKLAYREEQVNIVIEAMKRYENGKEWLNGNE
ncbi:TPA: hypothetical protein ACURGP_000886 [Staphylococcus aureus]